MTNNRGISYKAGSQWARMSWSSRFGAIAAAVAFIVVLSVLALLWPSQRQVSPQPAISKTTGPTQGERLAQARELEAKALQSKCTTGLPSVLKEAQAFVKAGDENMAAATLSPCIAISADPSLTAMVKAVEAARMVKVTKAAKEEAARKRKAGVSIGMSKEDVLASMWGKPRKINTTTTARGTREQWVYDGGYLYFDDNTLTAIQN